MATMRERRYNYLRKNGFFPAEARELSRTSRQGLLAPYFQLWIKSRRRLFANAKRYKWADREYRDYVKKQYTDRGFLKQDSIGRIRIDVWAMLRDYEEKARRRGEEYESPWKKRTRRQSTARREMKRVTRKDMLKSWIIQLDKSIDRTESDARRQQLINQKDTLEQQLKDMGNNG